MREVKIRKSEIAQLRGLGYNTQAISKHYNITGEDTIEVLKTFGLYKSKTTSGKQKEYTLNLLDDVTTAVTEKELVSQN